MDPLFWQGKKVFITGHTGFKGSWLTLWLNSLGAEVIGYALAPPTDINLFTEANIAKDIISIINDIRDYTQLEKAIHQHKPEIIIHMAAQPLVRYSYQHPIETYATNVMGTVHLFEAARSSNTVKVIVNVTTDKCYENKEWLWGYRENEAMGGYDPYSSSKGCAELVTAAYRNSYFNPQQLAQHGVALASARAGNVIGGGDWAQDRLIPDIMQSCLAQKNLLIRNPHAIRPWQHVLEPLCGYLMLAQALYQQPEQFCSAWNFGPNDDEVKPVSSITEYILQQWGQNLSWSVDQNPQPHEAHFLKLDCSKAKTELNWRPRWSLEKTLDSIVHWYQAYQKNANMRQITLMQIQQYLTT